MATDGSSGDHASVAGPPIIVFDTDCVLCSGIVAFVLRHEKTGALRFAGAWSREGLALADRYGFSKADLDQTFLLISDGRALTRSDAGLAILRYLRMPWSWLRVLAVIPRPLRDRVYALIARRRYRWFGHRENCVFVPADQRHRFIGVTSSASQSPALGKSATRTE